MREIILAAAILAGGLSIRAQVHQPGPRSDEIGAEKARPAELPKFDLAFEGGPPGKLVERIIQKIGTLNVIIPTELKNVQIPRIEVRQVNVSQLFAAITLASEKTVAFQTGFTTDIVGASRPMMQERTTKYGFMSQGPVTPESVWYFYANNPPELTAQKICRFYNLAPYLKEYKLDDITTAVQIAWRMLGESDLPELKFHEETPHRSWPAE